MRKLLALALLLGGAVILASIARWRPVFLSASQAPDVSSVIAQLKTQETNDSKVMWIMHEISDVHGPRLTGSPGLRAAQDWAVATMKSWGLANVHLEAWNFGHAGWQNYNLEANVTEPFQQPLNVRAVSWTPGTNGTVTAPVVLLTPPPPAPGGRGAGFAGRGAGANADEIAAMAQAGSAPPPMPPAPPAPAYATQASLDAYLNSMKDQVRGAIVFVGEPVQVPENWIPAPLRRPDESWETTGARGGRGRGRGAGRGEAPADALTAAQINLQVAQFLKNDGALVRVNDAGRAYGVIVQQSTASYNEPTNAAGNPNPPNIPTLLMGNEDYGRIARTLKDGIKVTLRVNIENRFYPEGKTVYNVVGEIPGTDKADEVVMLGGHFDSWNAATGATDNGAGSTVALEAIRLLHTLNLQPRRTIRVALWSGEEEGLLGSLAYVDQHFGTAENPKPEFARFDGYINLDDGTGKPRGASVFGPPEAAQMVQQVMSNFKDWGFYNVNPTVSRMTGGTDHTSFNRSGLPGIGFNQDPFDYETYTHHTNFDTYERIYEPDMREAAVEEAALAYALATADTMLPRCSSATLPPLPAGRGAGGGRGAPAPGGPPAPPPSCQATN